jgi:hypothetical protein
MARITDLEQATDKMLTIIESHMSNFSSSERQEKWDALERYVNNLPASQTTSHSKRSLPRTRILSNFK